MTTAHAANGPQNGAVTHHQLQPATGFTSSSLSMTRTIPTTVRHPTPPDLALLPMFLSDYAADTTFLNAARSAVHMPAGVSASTRASSAFLASIWDFSSASFSVVRDAMGMVRR